VPPETTSESAESRRAADVVMRGGVSAAIGFAIRLGARLLFLLVAGRLFGAALFGAFSLGQAVVELAVTLGSVGTKRTLFQFLDERGPRPAEHVVLDAAALVVVASAAAGVLIAAVTYVLPESWLPPATARALIVLTPMVAGQSLLDLFSAATRWQHLIRYDVVGRSVVEPYVGVAFTLLAFWIGARSDGLLIGYTAGTIAALVYVAWGARREFGGFKTAAYRPEARHLTQLARGTLANTGTDFLNAFYGRFDLYLVGGILGEAAAGVYGIARQVRTPIRQVRQSFDGLLTPIVAKTMALKGPVVTAKAIASAARLILTIQLPVLILLAAIGVPLLNAIGPGFAAGYWALLFLAAAELIQGAFGLGDLIFVYRRPEAGLWITALSIVVGLVLGVAMITLWGVTGAAIAVLVSYWGRAVHRRMVLAREFGVRVPLRYNAGPMAAALCGTVAALAAARVDAAPVTVYVLVTVAGLSVFGGVLLIWLRSTHSRLAIDGFVTGR
jgi:O-antigen/teichoic acid export membrane protein